MNAATPNPAYTREQLVLLRDLFAAGCVLIGDEVQRRFGLHSPIYINMRENLYANPELLWRVGGEFAWKIVELATPPSSSASGEAGAALASASIAESMGVPLTAGPAASATLLDRVMPVGPVGQAASSRDEGIPSSRDSTPAPQTVVGIPDTATPLALTTALFSWGNRTRPQITFGLLRKEAKCYPGHDPSYWLGPPAKSNDSDDGREYNLIDDVVASGLTKRAAAEKMRAEGIPLTRIIVFFDRGQGDGLREEGFALHSIFKLREVVDFYAFEGLISTSDHQHITEFLSARRFDRSRL